MSYTPHEWESDEVISAAKLNHLEEGIGALSDIVRQEDGVNILVDENGDSIPVSTIINEIYTCFRGDTTYVTMYDGTKKLIKDVKQGDSVLGYDVNRKEPCEAIVLRNVRTGEERVYDCYVFSDGTTIDIHGDDKFIAKYQSDSPLADLDGEIVGIYSIKTLLKKHNQGEDFRKVIKNDGDSIYLVCKFSELLKDWTGRYALYTSNGTCFVNGLLHGYTIGSMESLRHRRNMHFTDEINEMLDEICADQAELDESLPNDTISDPSKIDDIREYAKAVAEVDIYKKKLDEIDYYTNKHLEGKITDEQWQDICRRRDEYRAGVNEAEAKVAEYKANIEQDNPQIFGYSEGNNRKWKQIQAILDAHLEHFRDWAEQMKQ